MIEQLEVAVVEWAEEKGIFEKATPVSQVEKSQEELTELIIGIVKQDRDEIIDGIGDVTVTMIIQAHMQGLTLGECLAHSYRIISQRSGRMENGVFVKDE